jgi:hypothetical protein
MQHDTFRLGFASQKCVFRELPSQFRTEKPQSQVIYSDKLYLEIYGRTFAQS